MMNYAYECVILSFYMQREDERYRQQIKKDINDIYIKQTCIFRNLLTYQTDHLKSYSTDTLKSNNFTDFSLDCVSKKIKPKITLDGLRVFN